MVKSISAAILASLLSAAYWWIVFTILYAEVLFAADRDPAAQPAADHIVLLEKGAILFVAVMLYAVGVIVWQRLRGSRERGGR